MKEELVQIAHAIIEMADHLRRMADDAPNRFTEATLRTIERQAVLLALAVRGAAEVVRE